MKSDNTQSIISNDDGKKFTIKASGAAFKILSDGLYSDKAKAVVRELSCNAYDSHVAAGVATKPFEMHLPTTDEPWFSITDFGVGISEPDIYDIYTSYFTSTKTASNEYIGQLGLGSKSPFCMVDRFTVNSRHNGMQITYEMYFDTGDIPRVKKIFSASCASLGVPNSGVDIRFNVNVGDHAALYRAAVDVLGWFKVKPIQTGLDIPNLEDKSINLAGSKDWYMLGKNLHDDSSAKALMGNVAYQLDVRSIMGLTDTESYILNLPIVLAFDIGELEVAASRETISYDSRTTANLVAKIKKVSNEVIAGIVTDMASKPSEWAARQYWYHIFKIGPNASDLAGLCASTDLIWKGIKISSDVIELDLSKIYGKQSLYPVMFANKGRIYHKSVSDRLYAYEINVKPSTTIVIDDLQRGGKGRITEWIKSKSFPTIANGYRVPDSPTHAFKLPDGCTVDQLVAELGSPPTYTLTSTLPVVKKASPKSTFASNTVFVANGRTWHPTNIDLTAGGIYVEISNKDVYGPDGRCYRSFWTMQESYDIIAGAHAKLIYAVKKSVASKIKQLPRWENFIDVLKANVSAIVENEQYMIEYNRVSQWRSFISKYRIDLDPKNYKLRDPDGLMSKVLQHNMKLASYELSSEFIRTSHAVKMVSYLHGINQKTVLPDDYITQLSDTWNQRYPLLRFIPTHEKGHPAISDYINIVDQHYVWYALSESENTEDSD